MLKNMFDTSIRPSLSALISAFAIVAVAGGLILSGGRAAADAITPPYDFEVEEAEMMEMAETGEMPEMATITDCIVDSQGLDAVEDKRVTIVHGGDFVLLGGPCKVRIVKHEGPRNGDKSTETSIKRLKAEETFEVKNEETSEWDVDIEIHLLKGS